MISKKWVENDPLLLLSCFIILFVLLDSFPFLRVNSELIQYAL